MKRLLGALFALVFACGCAATGLLSGVAAIPSPDQQIPCTISGSNQICTNPNPSFGSSSFSVGISGTSWTGTFAFECSLDANTWTTCTGTPLGTTSAAVSSTSANGAWVGSLPATPFFRVRSTAWTSGSATVIVYVASGVQGSSSSGSAISSPIPLPISCPTAFSTPGACPTPIPTPVPQPLATASAGVAPPTSVQQVTAFVHLCTPAGATPAPTAGNVICAQADSNGAQLVHITAGSIIIGGIGNTYAGFTITSASIQELVPGVAGKAISVYAYDVVTSAAQTVMLSYSASTSCTSPTTIVGPWPFAANGGISKSFGVGPYWTLPSGDTLCQTDSTTSQAGGSVTYLQQ